MAHSSIDTSLHYSAKDIAEMRKEKEKDVKEGTLDYKLAEVSLKEIKLAMSDGMVRSKIDGVIKTVRDPNEAYKNSEALVVVSGGGGYLVNISVSELELSTVAVGDEVEIESFNNDAQSYYGKITSISDFPSSSSDMWSMGNPYASFYPCVISADEDAEMRDGDYVSVKYNYGQAQNEESFILEKMYVRSDNGGRYVYKAGENGTLTKTYIMTGKSPDSYNVEVTGGISENDYIAFPYGSDVEEGAPTEITGSEELYG